MRHDCQKTDDINVLYSNVRIICVEESPLAGSLSLKTVDPGWSENTVTYSDVLYSQIKTQSEGKRIMAVVEITPKEFRDPQHSEMADRFKKDADLANLDSLEEMVRMGYRLFTHYSGDDGEDIVIAKKVTIDGKT